VTDHELNLRLEAEQELSNLQSLLEAPGWKQFEAQMKRAKDNAEHSIKGETDPNKLMRAAGEYTALGLMLTWVERRAAAIQQLLSHAEGSFGND